MNYLKADEPFYQISQVAKIVGISADRLRTYEEEGLIKPYRKQGENTNKRLYSQNDIEKIIILRKLIKSGVSIIAIKLFLNIDFTVNMNKLNSKEQEIIDFIKKLKKV